MDPMDYMGQYQKYLMPWYNTGLQDFQNYSGIGNQMASDPMAYYNNIMSGYSQSPYAQQQTQYLTQNAQNAAAKGGYVGTPQEQMDMANQLQRLISGDQQQYYQDVMEPQQMGMQALAHGSDLGMGATRELGDMYSNMARIASGQSGQMSSLFGGLLGAGMGAAGKIIPAML